jgi:SAM-dependent methyltransferase
MDTALLPEDLVRDVDTFKTRMLETDRAIVDGRLDQTQAQATVSDACAELSRALQVHTQRWPHRSDAVGAFVFRETFPFFMQSAIVLRCFSKPRGFPGDYCTIELFYQNQADGHGRLGPLIDRWARETASSRAVKNRRRLLTAAIRQVAARFPRVDPLRVTSVASGPARELLDLLTEAGAPPVRATCIDFDDEALQYAAKTARQLGVERRLEFARANVIRLARGAGTITLAPNHMIYSVGLFDYLTDDDAVLLLNWMHDHLLPEGTIVVGNFDVASPDRAFMDHIAEWRLNYRSAGDMRTLFARSRFGATPVEVLFEEAKVNLFAFCTREPSGAVALAAA